MIFIRYVLAKWKDHKKILQTIKVRLNYAVKNTMDTKELVFRMKNKDQCHEH